MNASTAGGGVEVLLRSLKLPSFVRVWGEVAEQAEREGWGFERYLHQLAEIEVEERRVRRIERLRKRSADQELPAGPRRVRFSSSTWRTERGGRNSRLSEEQIVQLPIRRASD